MSLSLFPHQVLGVEYLKKNKHALLWDEQRVGKTPQAIVASGELGLNRVLVITTVAGVGVWQHQWHQWDTWNRKPVIVPWSHLSAGNKYAKQLADHYDLVIVDESQYAKNPTAIRTKRLYGTLLGANLNQASAVIPRSTYKWCLTGTPMTHDPGDLFCCLKALFPNSLTRPDLPDVSTFLKFRARYCVVVQRLINNRMISVVMRGQNLDELKFRIKGMYLRRRQAEIGIRPAFWDTLPIILPHAQDLDDLWHQLDDPETRAMFARGELTERHLAEIRRITGKVKAQMLVVLVKEYLETYGDKLVVAYWHKQVGDILEQGLAKYNPVRVDGSVTGDTRTQKVAQFSVPNHRLFLAQIAACGEAIDLSAAAEMWFCESVFTPSQMAQMGARITNLKQPKQCLVRVAALADSIDELIQERLVDLSRAIATTLGETYNENFSAV